VRYRRETAREDVSEDLSPVTDAVTEAGDPTPALAANAAALPASEAATVHRTVARGTLFLVVAQFLTTPISIVLNMILTRRLGAEEFGTLFLAGNLTGLAFLFVDWGQTQSIAGATARDRSAAPRLLGSGLVLKLCASFLAAGVLWLIGFWLHYSREVQLALALTSLQTAFVTLAASYGAVIRGFERLDRLTQLTMIGNLLNFALVVPAALSFGHLTAVLVAQCLCSGIMLALFIWRGHQVGVRVAAPSALGTRELMHAGSGFFLLGVVLALQPTLDSMILEKLSPAEVVGWYSSARRFIGFIIFPATTLNYAIYPTLCRLLKDSRTAFIELGRTAFRVVVLFGVPGALGCALYALPVMKLFSGAAFASAAPILQVLSLFVFLVFLTIIFGSILAAEGLQLRFALAQLACVLVSAVGDPLLIPWSQRRFANGGIGLGITSTISEVLMIGAAIYLGPKGLIDKSVLLTAGRSVVAGCAMVAAGLAAQPLPLALAMLSSLAAYGVVLLAIGGVKKDQVEFIASIALRKLKRGKAAA
jgi:O-antigen/teichoic acid export membrane protein